MGASSDFERMQVCGMPRPMGVLDDTTCPFAAEESGITGRHDEHSERSDWPVVSAAAYQNLLAHPLTPALSLP
jgi:hypothetical protein